MNLNDYIEKYYSDLPEEVRADVEFQRSVMGTTHYQFSILSGEVDNIIKEIISIIPDWLLDVLGVKK